jgi:hypothetical protein
LNIVPTASISGLPGATAGWGFTLENSTDYAVVTQAILSDLSRVDFTDFISPQFVVIGPDGLYAQSFWAQPFDLDAQTGIGAAAIHSGLLPGVAVPETITLFYDLYGRSPLDPDFTPDDAISFGNQLQVEAGIEVAAPSPEPGTLFAAGGALLLLGIRWSSCRRVIRSTARTPRSSWRDCGRRT